MENDVENLWKISTNTEINPSEFDITISSFLIGLGAEKYIEIFKKHNIGQCTLSELSDEDLIKLGVDDSIIRQKILNEVKNLPIYSETTNDLEKLSSKLSPVEIADVLEESSQHLYRIYLSMLANTLALKKTKGISDCVLYEDKYASDIALATLAEMTNIINSMDISLHTQLKDYTKPPKAKKKKMLVGTLGTAAIIVLTVMFVKSLRKL